MGNLNLLPEKFRNISLSDREIVLPFPEIMEAIEILRKSKIGFLGWEGWAKYNKMQHGHFSDFYGIESERLDKDETWNNYVSRTCDLCKKTIEIDYKRWVDNFPRNPELFFCLSEINEAGYKKLIAKH